MRNLLRIFSGKTTARWFTNFVRRSSRARARLFTLLSAPAFYKIGRSTTLMLPCQFGGERWISIGDHVFIGPGCWLQTFGSSLSKTVSPLIEIEDNVSITGLCMISAVTGVVIERGALIARHVHISDHSHNFDDKTIPISKQGITDGKPVRIGAGAWIGHGAVICPGVTIGRGSVIGANSVVRNDIPERCVAAGIPAKVLRWIDSEA